MRVHVRPLRLRGSNLNRDQLKDCPPYVGVLKVAEARDHELGRPVIRARLIDPVVGTEADVLPELGDARLLWAEGTTLQLTGFERIESVDYVQTWTVELA